MKTMKKALLSLALCGTVFVQTVAPVYAEPGNTPAEVVLFQDDFESGTISEMWSTGKNYYGYENNSPGEYTIAGDADNKVMNVKGKWDGTANVNAGKKEWKDYSVEAEITINGAAIDSGDNMYQYNCAGVVGHMTNSPDKAYQTKWGFLYRTETGLLELNRVVNGDAKAVVKETYPLEENKAYRMKLTFEGNKIYGYIAEKGQEFKEAVLTYTDEDNVLSYGGGGVECGGLDIDVDNVKISTTNVPTTITLDRTETTLKEGKTRLLSASFGPENASCNTVIWSSDDENVATVDASGRVKAIKEGTATITATVEGNDSCRTTCKVEVIPNDGETADGILFEDDFSSGEIGLDWTIGRRAFAGEGQKGNYSVENEVMSIEGTPFGSANVNAGKSEWVDYSVEADVTFTGSRDQEGYPYYFGISGHMGEPDADAGKYRWGFYYKENGKLILQRTYANSDSTVKEADYTWNIGDTRSMKMIFEGDKISCYIGDQEIFTHTDSPTPYCYGGGGIDTYDCSVRVDNVKFSGYEREVEATGINLNKNEITLHQGSIEQLMAFVTPGNASDQSVTWRSSASDVAEVDETGEVKAVGTGKATITATSNADDKYQASCEVNVVEKAADCTTFYYISPDGSDENSGSEAYPFRTLEKARDTIRAMENLPEGGVTVYLRGGEYNLDETFTLTPEDSGEFGKPIVYTSYPGEEAYIVSKEAITGWEKAETDIEGLHTNAQGKVYVADIEKGWRFHFLYADGESQQVSEYTSSDDFLNWPRVLGSSQKAWECDETSGRLLYLPDGYLDGLDGWEDMELKMSTAMWWNINGVAKDINSSDNSLRLHSQLAVQYGDITQFDGGYFNITNTLKYLDTEGEWAVDSVNGKVYYWPKEGKDPNECSMFAPKLHELVRFQGDEEEDQWKEQVHDITFRNLNFYYTDRTPEDQMDEEWLTRNAENPDGLIFMQGVRDCTIEDCVIAYSGAQGIAADHYAQNLKITGNEIKYSSSGGVQITGYGPGTVDVNKNHLIQRNHIHNIGSDYMHSCAVQFYGSNNNLVEYNYVHDLPYAAVSIVGMRWDQMNDPNKVDTYDSYGSKRGIYQARWDDFDSSSITDNDSSKPYQHSDNIVVQYNICDSYMQVMKDGSALYAWSSGTNKKWLYNVGKADGDSWAHTIYMDHFDVYNTVEGNRFYAVGMVDICSENLKNRWEDNIVTQRAGEYDEYVALRTLISNTAADMGGWLTSEYSLKTIKSVEVSRKPVKTEYVIGEELDLTGMELMVTYDDGSTAVVTSGFAAAGFNSDTAGTKELTITYSGKTTNLNVTVKAADKADLQKVYDEYMKLEKDKYTDLSWSIFQKAMEIAGVVLEDENADDKDIAAALKTLQDAYKGLKLNESQKPDGDDKEPGNPADSNQTDGGDKTSVDSGEKTDQAGPETGDATSAAGIAGIAGVLLVSAVTAGAVIWKRRRLKK